MKLYFASGNENKVKEIKKVIPKEYEIYSLKDLDLNEDIPETEPTLEGNALLKARHLAEKFDISVFADDTGLEIEALDGAPGVHSARYSGEDKNSQRNIEKVLQNLKGIENRNAQFRTVVALIINGEEHLFEGTVKGTIRTSPSGNEGFGYDPIFQPKGYNITFAEMDMDEKNKISHRGLAIQKLVEFLKK